MARIHWSNAVAALVGGADLGQATSMVKKEKEGLAR